MGEAPFPAWWGEADDGSGERREGGKRGLKGMGSSPEPRGRSVPEIKSHDCDDRAVARVARVRRRGMRKKE